MEGYDSERESLQNESPDASSELQPSYNPALILSLPEEIIVHISLEACTPLYESESSVRAVQLVTPSFLGKICKQWRQIAMSTQELWRFILIAIREPLTLGGLENKAQIEHFKTCMDRSGNYPLFVQLAGDGDYSPDTDLLDNIYDMLQLCSHRIGHFSSLEVPSLIETLGELKFPSLTSMAFGSYADWWWCLVKDAPLFHSLSLSRLSLSTDDLKWEELIELKLIRCRWTTCFKDLCLAQNLVHCHLCDLDLGPLLEFTDDDSIAQLPQLTTLIMSNTSAAVLMAVLNRIETPALKRLEVQWEERWLYPLISIASLVARSSCTLDQLGITAHPVDDARVIIGCLDSILNLSRLELYLTKSDAVYVIHYLCRTAHSLNIATNHLSFHNLHEVIDEIPLLSNYKALFDEIDERRSTTALEQRRRITNFKIVRLIIPVDHPILENVEAYKEVPRHGLIFTIPSIHSETY